MKFLTISDTHNTHHHFPKEWLIPADAIIHAGDFTNFGTKGECQDFLNWFSGLSQYKYKIFIAGNHDMFFDSNWKAYTERGKERWKNVIFGSTSEINDIIPPNLIYLNNSGVTIDNINIWGSPETTWYHDWGFNREVGKDMQEVCDLIPTNTDLLITHGPPSNILDKMVSGVNIGSVELSHTLQRVKPKVHIFGHIHEAYGHLHMNDTDHYNASSYYDWQFKQPFLIELL